MQQMNKRQNCTERLGERRKEDSRFYGSLHYSVHTRLMCVYISLLYLYFVFLCNFILRLLFSVCARAHNLPFFWFCSLKLYTNGCAYKMHREKSDYKKTFNPTKALVAAYKTEKKKKHHSSNAIYSE